MCIFFNYSRLSASILQFIDVSNQIRSRNCTSSPFLNDTDSDNIDDLTEFQWKLCTTTPDSDDDGLPDGTEDTNQNGIVDEHETSPTLFDSDDV